MALVVRRSFPLAVFCLVSILTAGSAFAGLVPFCDSGTVSEVLNTTCVVGHLQFTFQEYSAPQYDFDFATSVLTQYATLDPASVGFAPASGGDGFVISVPSQSVTSNGN
jgi:hypothetical protein